MTTRNCQVMYPSVDLVGQRFGRLVVTKFNGRINNDGDYEPGNCRWADDVTQANNRRPRRWRFRPKEN